MTDLIVPTQPKREVARTVEVLLVALAWVVLTVVFLKSEVAGPVVLVPTVLAIAVAFARRHRVLKWLYVAFGIVGILAMLYMAPVFAEESVYIHP